MKVRLVGVGAAIALAAAAEAWACSCIRQPPIADALAAADAVFVGSVTRVERGESLFGLAGIVVRELWSGFTGTDDSYVEKWEDSARYGHVAHMRISEAFKGLASPTVLVHTGFGGGDCGYAFAEGIEYVVYAYVRDDALQAGRRFHATSICARTRPLSEVGDEVGELRQLASGVKKWRGWRTTR